jgi:hypothetical protein
MKKAKMIQTLNDLTKPYNLQVAVGAPMVDKTTQAITYSVNVNLIIMEEAKTVEGKTVQPTHRMVNTVGFGSSIDEAKTNALTEALQYAGVI